MSDALQANLMSQSQHDTINSFYDKIHKATIESQEWVETSPEIIKYYNKHGLGKADYFIFQGIKVCEYGKSEAIQKGLERQVGQILYGESEGKVNLGESTKPVGANAVG